MAGKKKISRRKFLVRGGLGTAGVLAVGAYIFRNPIRRSILEMANTMEMSYMGETKNPMVWFELLKNNTVLLHSPKVEMGQGTFTSLAQMAADELEVPLDMVEVVHAATATGNIDGMSTGGSTSVSGLWQPLRELAATMREMIKAQAAVKLGVDMGSVTVKEGMVSADGKSLTYAEVAEGVTEWPEVDVPKLKPTSSYKFVGKPIPRIDLKDKVFGTPMFGMDASAPNMLYGAVVRPTKIGATFVSADTSKVAEMPGVIAVVEEVDFVGVVADTYQQAENAKNAISIEWDAPNNLTTADIESMMTVGNGKSTIIQKEGDAIEENDDGVEVLEFRSPIGAHAQIEPNGVLASVEDDKATITISTQVIGITRKEVAERLGFDEENVNVIPTYLGGGFGRRLHTPHAVQAAVMSKAVGKPVKYFFTRKEEFQHDMFRPPTHHVVKGRLNAEGHLQNLEHHFVSGDVGNNSVLIPNFVPTILGADIGSIRGGFVQYTNVPNHRAVYWHVPLPFATSWWRSLGLLANTFAIESFIDHMAHKAGKNAADFRMASIADDEMGKRLKATITAAVEKAGYTEEVTNERAMGLAASIDAGTPCAQVAEVSIEDNEIVVHSVTVALDPGIAVNPDQVRAQCEGCVIMGMSAAMHEQMFVEEGELRPIIYGPYEMALMKHAPKEIDVVLLQGIDRPGPVGEPPLGPIGAAVANAVFRLTGKRLTKMPLRLS
ncbi:xanthine dehydrogenase family protein molybdopterin-binding subunit [Allomuricauda sp. SCSIO 65647]|uniref:xanthine dehydrogenase family protein molybdopterin-binding subunit n=1 Tax=Allomuricauda sp. SCSIO 65647 TaxID=2908843 RepID=UPI001F1D3519|nr:molybdopterin cofactor-binding domain-containing protein [Muricauda sp. SCSIO 65647]UJH68768.1 molybdopterin-dependent oxidoreductase [Muricauda sp. SCSIO 65647]